MKKIEKILNVFLWTLWSVLSLFLIILFIGHKAPDFEYYTDTGKSFKYVYTDEAGNKANSTYHPAWFHPQEQFWFIGLYPKKSVIRFYDPTYKTSAGIKDQYMMEFQALMPKSNIEWWRHWTSLISVFGIIVLAVLVFFLGGYIRDFILFLKAKKEDRFLPYAYFLTKNRRLCCSKKAKKGLCATIDSYIVEIKENRKHYSENFINLLVQILYAIKQTKTIKIPFYYYQTDTTKQQKEYLTDLSLYCRNQINSYENLLKTMPNDIKTQIALKETSNNLKLFDSLKNEDYIKINVRDADASATTVAIVLDNLFEESYGYRIIRFKACKYYNTNTLKEGAIIVNSRIFNTSETFNLNGVTEKIPGLRITLIISCYQNGQEQVLWKKNLPPKCTYSYMQEDSPDFDALYSNMINETINAFPDEIKK
jgi:hypothetical protein